MTIRTRLVGAVFLLIFFWSGFAALVYQTVWQRVLTLFGGADVYSVTIIVAAFMAGLGFGHLAGGHLADRLGRRARMALFASCEVAVGLFALASTALYYDYIYVRFGGASVSPATLGLVVFGLTLFPTFLMGMSLPLAARALSEHVERPARWVSLLYGWNTLGAACGSCATVAVLFRAMDLPGALRVGAVLSGACGLAALLMIPALSSSTVASKPRRPLPVPHATDGAADAGTSFATPVWILVYALSGFIALSLEIVWFRVLAVVLKSNAFTFGYLLTIYLGGVGVGALVGHARLLQRLRPAAAFFAVQALIPVYAATALGVLALSVGNLDVGRPLWDYMAAYETMSRADLRLAASGDPGRLIAVLGSHLVVPLFLIAPPTIMMGVSFGLLQRAVQNDVRILGRRVGWLQAANVVGAMVGATVTGLVLLEQLGSVGTLRMLVAASLVFAWLYVRSSTAGVVRRVGLVAVSVLVAVFSLPSSTTLWARLHNASPTAVVQEEDGSGLSLLKLENHDVDVFVNGLGQSQLPYGGVHTALGALPVLLHPNPRRIAVIGLGSGDTVFGTGGRVETETIESIEIIGAQIETLHALTERWAYPGLQQLLADPRVHFEVTDGRAYIRRSKRRYDVIEADALRPSSAFAGNLYSVEYFALLRDRLEPGGYAVTWAATERIRNGLAQVFPHVLVIREVAIGSTRAIPGDLEIVRDRLRVPFTKSYYARGAVPIDETLGPYLTSIPLRIGPDTDRSTMGDVNRDLFPKDEFAVR